MALSRKPLKGMRELFPEEKRVEDYIIDQLAKAGSAYGFEAYEAPILEPLDLFLAKSGRELAMDQSYNFTDKGGRNLIMRPELTPSTARMVAAAGELIFPVKWMSFPLCYRYENTQRGRAREFLQFNLDILGVDGLEAELEIFLVLQRIMDGFSAVPGQYSIRYSSRKLASGVLMKSGFTPLEMQKAFAVIDKKDKMPLEKWQKWLQEEIADSSKAEIIMKFASCEGLNSAWLSELMAEDPAYTELLKFSNMLDRAGVASASFEAGVVRGLDYYTGIVFEVMDKGGKNRRSICGGGRYDNLVGMFSSQNVSGVGFGLGILTLKLFLQTYGLIPDDPALSHPADIFLAVCTDEQREFAMNLAESLRDTDISVEMDISRKNLSKQYKIADRKAIRYVVAIGPDEVDSGHVTIRDMNTGENVEVDIPDIRETLSMMGN
ncbi:MAG: histidine--tRNA ligase [Candidatus Aegiribacteria sp.]|nr:histidine--tRNA ligase [Candidatus Aegiribacteria sp.]